MDYEETDVEALTDYFTEIYRNDEPLQASLRNVFGDFIRHQVLPSDSIEANELINALEHDSEDYDWRKFEREFQVFLEKRLDRHHGGSIENPERRETDVDVERSYNLGYIATEVASPEVEEVYMTSVIQFEDTESNGYAVEVDYLNEDEGFEAIRHLLQEGEEEKVDEMIRFGLKINPDRALKAYDVVIDEDPDLARNLMEGAEDPELRDSMESKLVENEDLVKDSRNESDR